jgi:hypothetical protein
VVAWSGYFLEVSKSRANLDRSCLGTHVHRLASIRKFITPREFGHGCAEWRFPRSLEVESQSIPFVFGDMFPQIREYSKVHHSGVLWCYV